ncbi:MAG TPA: O-antigen ligase family protein [Thermoleophilaceae bacterium]
MSAEALRGTPRVPLSPGWAPGFRLGSRPLRRRRWAAPTVMLVAAALAGALAGANAKMALAAAGACVLLALPFAAPVTALVLVVAITAIVPFDVQNSVALGGGPGRPGLIASDVLLAAGLARGALALLDTPLQRRAGWILAATIAVLGAAIAQAVHGLRSGHDPGTAGTELRTLLGLGAAVIAMPLLADATARARLFRAMLGVGLAIGLWGIVQWTVDIPFTAAGDAGVRAGVRLTTEGRGQIQGGLYAFPVVVVMGIAALLSHEIRAPRTRALLVAVVALNAADLVLTYERTFWVATLLALVYLALHATPRQRLRALILGPALLAVVVAGMAFVAPGDMVAARQRLLSIGQYGSDLSVRFRVTETANVTQAIASDPLRGSGLGATIIWGRPYEGVRPTTESFAHDGYLWLAWKLGVPVAVLVVLLFGAAVLLRGPPPASSTYGALRAGARSSLLLLLIASVTFPSFNTLGITAAMGVLVALCAAPAGAPLRPSQEEAP